MAGLENFLKTYSAGEEYNTKDFHLEAETNIDSNILADVKKYIGRPVSVEAGKVVGYNGSSFHGVVANDCGKYGIGIASESIALSKKGVRVVLSGTGLVNGDLVKITGTGDTAIFSKATPAELTMVVGKAVGATFLSFEGMNVTPIDFNTAFIATGATAPAGDELI